ncbi:proton-conducting transporter transmembrane domain-containing protein [Anianabacter salinae]|uniref:proton-conducting transporter transmembrane domain-containing protein n=1 Tax=Anianabacter salinae TaxID=2851023 RepID=UPI00225DFA9C|nr:proton-conducting transporter membrane subunit [Anianabacter salinae]MBV0912761.1 monovalent cation/H+ antiporter subunit D family protein [Anianabacter salinae]
MSAVSLAPILAIFSSLAGLVGVGAFHASVRMRNTAVLVAAVCQTLVLLYMVPAVLDGQVLTLEISTLLPGAGLAFRVDGLGLTFALIASILWLVTAIYSFGYLDILKSGNQSRFQALFALTITFTVGVAFAANLVSLYLFYEAMTVATYFLVTHDDTDEAHAGGRRYLAYHLGTSIAFLLPAIGLTWHLAGSLSFVQGGLFADLDTETHRGMLTLAFVLFLAGSAKVAIMPLHGWLPGAMVAPVPVSALLHAVAVVNAGAYGVLRILSDVFGAPVLTSLGLDQIGIWLASFTVVAASLYALRLDNLKALLAFSTIGQLAYIVLGASLANPDGAMGGMLHILNHGLSKITLFLCAGAIYVATHKKYVSEMAGLAREMPLTVLAFAIGAFSMIGLPLTAGFISKWYLFAGAQDAGSMVALAALILSSMLSAAYYLRALAIFMGWTGERSARLSRLPPVRLGTEVDGRMLWPLVVCAIMTLLVGVFPDLFALPLLVPVVEASFMR